jgi:cytochrome P450
MLSPIEAVTHPDPYPYYAMLVAERPCYFDEQLRCWVAGGAQEVTAALSEVAGRVRPVDEPVPAGIAGTAAGDVFGALVRMTDGELHQRLRAVVVDALGNVDYATVSALAAERARNLLKSETATLDDLMFGVPAQVIAILCGLDNGEAEEATRLIGEFVQCLPASASADQQAAAARAAQALQQLMGPRLMDTTSGLLGELVRAAQRADWAGTAPLLANGIGFLSQTYDGTAGLIGNTLLTLRRTGGRPSPAELERFVREVARYDSPVHNTRRFAAHAFSLGGHQIDEGQSVLVLLAAANRDPAVNPDPHTFNPDRPMSTIFTFGMATHGCPGERLATTIAVAVVGELRAGGFDPSAWPDQVPYRPLPNVRIPVFPSLHPI